MVNSFIFYVNLLFLELGMIDMSRRLFLMKALNGVLEPNLFKKPGLLSTVPFMNIFDKASLVSWIDMRVMVFDIGLRF